MRQPVLRSVLFLLLLAALSMVHRALVAQPSEAARLSAANERLQEAHQFFDRGEFERAKNLYLDVGRSGFGTAAVWTNAGTAAFRAGQKGEAVLYYQRALRQDPGYAPARSSLAVVSPVTNSSEGNDFLRDTLGRTPVVLWVLLAEALFILVCYALAKWVATWRQRDERGHWLAVLAWSVVLCVAFGGVAWLTHETRIGGREAVILHEGAIARSEPREDSTAQLELPAGTVVELTEDPRRGFVRVRLLDGRTGYVNAQQVEPI